MNFPRRRTIIGIVVVAAIALVASLFFIVHKPQPGAPVSGAPSPADSLSTSTSPSSSTSSPTPAETPEPISTANDLDSLVSNTTTDGDVLEAATLPILLCKPL